LRAAADHRRWRRRPDRCDTIQVADLALTIQDPLLARVRSLLRKDYGFTREAKKKFGIPAVFSGEPLRYPPRRRFLPAAPVR
jgi:tRNA A37 threonylcarbamoyladenosine dehydratase